MDELLEALEGSATQGKGGTCVCQRAQSSEPGATMGNGQWTMQQTFRSTVPTSQYTLLWTGSIYMYGVPAQRSKILWYIPYMSCV